MADKPRPEEEEEKEKLQLSKEMEINPAKETLQAYTFLWNEKKTQATRTPAIQLFKKYLSLERGVFLDYLLHRILRRPLERNETPR